MSASATTAFDAAERLHLDAPWEVFGERSHRYEIHLNGRSIELVRGPILLEGIGLRVFRPQEGATRIGYQATTDLTPEGLRQVAADATALAEHSSFPAKTVPLPDGHRAADVEVRDPRLWERPMDVLQEYIDALLAPFDGKQDVAPSFGSVRAALTETTITNSAGLKVAYPHTTVWIEMAVKAYGGPEGRPPGEYWVNETVRRLDAGTVGSSVESWSQFARDVRHADVSPSGDQPVVLPSSVLATILPPVIGFRFTGGARLRHLAPEVGDLWGAEALTVRDDGRIPWAVGSSPVDDEGTVRDRRDVLDRGKVTSLLYDARYAGVFDTSSTGSAIRRHEHFLDWRRFLYSPGAGVSTLDIPPGTGGSDAELAEIAGNGIWIQQLGWAVPDAYSGAFGGEVRIGYRIRNGKIAEPVRGGIVGGTVLSPPGSPSLLRDIRAIGSTPSLAEGLRSPTVLVMPLTVGGA
jgi:predicted Zn-dependent protease